MKKILVVIGLLFAATFAFADTWLEFEQKVLATYPWAEYVSYEVYEQWNGDTEAFLKFLYENPVDLDTGKLDM